MNTRIVAHPDVGKVPPTPVAYMTTSWDDGHPLDQRVADLLSKYGLRGTFYIPRQAQNESMSPQQIRDLSGTFEVAAHTLTHLVLPLAPDAQARKEIVDSKAWIEDGTGLLCRMFCPPCGKYKHRHVIMIQQAGYVGMRTVELLSPSLPRAQAGLLVLPTTVQAIPHGAVTYLRNAIRNVAVTNFCRYLVHGRSRQWVPLARALLSRVIDRGGVFHLWGHSWEIDKHGQWHQLEEVLRFMGDFVRQAQPLTNYDVCQAVKRVSVHQNKTNPVAAIGGMPSPDFPKVAASKERQGVPAFGKVGPANG